MIKAKNIPSYNKEAGKVNKCILRQKTLLVKVLRQKIFHLITKKLVTTKCILKFIKTLLDKVCTLVYNFSNSFTITVN